MARWQEEVDACEEHAARCEKAEGRWKEKKKLKAMQEARTTLRAMTGFIPRCMYCERNDGGDLDHYWPRSVDPGRTFVWENLLWVCSPCNSSYKRDQFPVEEVPLLLDPTVDEPWEHLRLKPANGDLEGTTRRGEETVGVFGLNASERGLTEGRRYAWTRMQALLIAWFEHRLEGRAALAEELMLALLRDPFLSPLTYARYVWEYRRKALRWMVEPRCWRVFEEFGEEIGGWGLG